MDAFREKTHMRVVDGPVLIDSNVLIYATLRDDPRYAVSQRLLNGDLIRGGIFVSVQNLSEMYPNLTGPKMNPPDDPELARRKVLSIASLPTIQVLPITIEILRLALELCERHTIRRQLYFDMQIAASMLVHRIPIIATENIDDFKNIAGIRAVNPFSDEC